MSPPADSATDGTSSATPEARALTEMSMSRKLFHFRFTGDLDSRRTDLLREASGMRISLANNHDREPGQGSIGPGASLLMFEGTNPDTWEIEARAYDGDDYDREEVERRRQSIRRALPQIADRWEEVVD